MHILTKDRTVKPRFAVRFDGRRQPVYKPCVRPLAVLRARVRKQKLAALVATYTAKVWERKRIIAGAPTVLTLGKTQRIERPGNPRRRRHPSMNPRVAQTWTHHIGTSAAPDWPNEPVGMSIGWDDDMSTDYSFTDTAHGNRHPGTHNTTDLNEGQATPGTSNQANWVTGAGYPAAPEFGPPGLGNGSGQSQAYNFGSIIGSTRPREIYHAAWVYPSSNFQFHSGGLTKTMWLGTTTIDGSGNPEADLGASFVIGPAGVNEGFHIKVVPQYPAGNGSGNAKWVGSHALVKGVWNLIEIYAKGNSAGNADGIFKLWLSTPGNTPTLEINVTDCLMSRVAENKIGRFSGTKFDPYWGGTGDTLLVDCYYKYSHYRITYKDAA